MKNQSIDKILTYQTFAKIYFIPNYLDFSRPILLNSKMF